MAEARTIFFTRNENIGNWPQPIASLSEGFNRDGRPAGQLGRQVGEASAEQFATMNSSGSQTQAAISLLAAFERPIFPPLNDAEYAVFEEGFYEGAGLEREA